MRIKDTNNNSIEKGRMYKINGSSLQTITRVDDKAAYYEGKRRDGSIYEQGLNIMENSQNTFAEHSDWDTPVIRSEES